METEGRILEPPSVVYAGRRPEPVGTAEAAWMMREFTEPGNVERFAVYLLKAQREENGLSEDQIKKFIDRIKTSSNKSGMLIGNCADSGVWLDSQVEECVRYCNENRIGLCLFIRLATIYSKNNINLARKILRVLIP